jgi:hypothetical protein
MEYGILIIVASFLLAFLLTWRGSKNKLTLIK